MMDQTEFAAFLQVPRQQYNQWERHKKQPNLETAWELAKKLQIKIEDLFEEREVK